MEWILISLFLLSGIGWWIWRHYRIVPFATTHHTVDCPLHNQSADIAVHTKFKRAGSQRHVDVTSCSLHYQGPITPPEKVVWVPDLPYSNLRFQKGNPAPIHVREVPCRKGCLHLLNQAEGDGIITQKRCVFGVMDCSELARKAAPKTASESSALRTPWSYS